MLKTLGSIEFFQEISNMFTTQKTKPVLEEAIKFLLLPLRIIENAIDAVTDTEIDTTATDTDTEIATEVTTTTTAIASSYTEKVISDDFQLTMFQGMTNYLFFQRSWKIISNPLKMGEEGYLSDRIDSVVWSFNKVLPVYFDTENSMIIVKLGSIFYGCIAGWSSVDTLKWHFAHNLLHDLKHGTTKITTTATDTVTKITTESATAISSTDDTTEIDTVTAIATTESTTAISSTSAIAVVETEEIKNRSAKDGAIDIPNWMQYKLLEEMLENKSLFLGQDWQKIEVEQKDIAWFGCLADDVNMWDYNLNRLLKIGFHSEEKMIIVGNNGCKGDGAAISKIIRTFSEALLAKVESTTAIAVAEASTTAIAPIITEIAPTTIKREVREDGYLIPITGDKVYTYTGGMFGASKWTGTVVKINDDGNTMQIEKHWQKTKSGKPSRMTVVKDNWKVEADPQREVERQKAIEEEEKEESEANVKRDAAKEATEKAYSDAISSGKEIPFDIGKVKKGDVITTYDEDNYLGSCAMYKYKYRELREDKETILASPIKNGRASTAQLCIGSINEEGKGKGKITIEKKSVSKPKKDGFHCDRRYALNEVSPWVNARLTNVFNSIDDYPQEFNTDRRSMAKGLENWKYQQKYRLTAIDIEKIDYVIECLS